MQLQQSNNVFYNVHTDKGAYFGWGLNKDTKKDIYTSGALWSCRYTRVHTYGLPHTIFTRQHTPVTPKAPSIYYFISSVDLWQLQWLQITTFYLQPRGKHLGEVYSGSLE